MAQRTVVIASKGGLPACLPARFSKAAATTGGPASIRQGDGRPVLATGLDA